jgi:hypothetical protein
MAAAAAAEADEGPEAGLQPVHVSSGPKPKLRGTCGELCGNFVGYLWGTCEELEGNCWRTTLCRRVENILDNLMRTL